MKGFNVLTGQPTLNNIDYTRPVAIVVDNVASAYATQTGLDQADVLYESLVAPGITRFLMVTADYKLLDKVSNIRSACNYHMDFADYHNAVLVCHGGYDTPNYDFYTLATERYGSRYGFIDTSVERYFAWADDGKKYGTIESADRKDLANNTVFKPTAMSDLLAASSSKFIAEGKGTLSGQTKNSLKFEQYGTKKDLSGASSAMEVTLKFKCQGSGNVKNVSFAYDAETGKYLRSQDGNPHLDSQTGKQLGFTNVIALFTTVEAKSTGIENDPTMTIMNTVSEDVMKSNVKLSVVHYKRSGLGFYPCASSTGSGVIYKRTGNYYFLLTNNHVVNTADETVDKTTLTVFDCYGNASEGELLYSSADYDLAIVRFESEKLLSALEISERIPNEEETVIAVSSPKGQYNTVTFGNVKDFEAVDLEDKGELSKISFPVLWHTAVCDNGSSGGALLDTDLKLIGVNFATAHNSDGSFAFSFAVSGDKLYDFIREYEHLRNDA
jgi:S1-C subfamily serine protease